MTTIERAEERPYTTKHQLAHLRLELLASRKEVAELRAAGSTAELDRIERALHVELAAANARTAETSKQLAVLRRRSEQQRHALETIARLAQAREVDWAALLDALREGLKA